MLGRLDDAGQVPALIMLYAESCMRTGDPRAARRWLVERQAVLALSGDRMAIRRAANLTGAACLEQGDLDAAADAFERALAFGRTDGDDLLVARATNNLAVIASIRGRLSEALGLYAMAIPAYQNVGNTNGIAESYHNAAIAKRKLGWLDAADDYERRAADFARQVGNDHLVALTLVGRAEISLLRGDAPLAEVAAHRAANDLGAVPDPARQADALRVCGTAKRVLGKFDEARITFDQAVDLAVAHANAFIEAESRWARAQLQQTRGETGAALDDAERAAAIFRKVGAPTELEAVSEWIGARRRHPT